MKKIVFVILTLFFSATIYETASAAPKYDTTKAASGILTVTYDGETTAKTLLIMKKAGSTEQYTYPITKNKPISVPLQLGNGEYSAVIAEATSGGKARVLSSEKFNAKITSPNDMYLISPPQVSFNNNMNVIKAYKTTLKALSGNNDKVTKAYEDIVTKYSYDNEKAKKLSGGTGYFPDIDQFYASKKRYLL